MPPIGRLLILLGLILILVGGLVTLFSRLGLHLGHLPGDFRIARGNLTCVVALGTSILLSILFTIALNIIVRFLNK
jgi:hypothetical protein